MAHPSLIPLSCPVQGQPDCVHCLRHLVEHTTAISQITRWPLNWSHISRSRDWSPVYNGRLLINPRVDELAESFIDREQTLPGPYHPTWRGIDTISSSQACAKPSPFLQSPPMKTRDQKWSEYVRQPNERNECKNADKPIGDRWANSSLKN